MKLNQTRNQTAIAKQKRSRSCSPVAVGRTAETPAKSVRKSRSMSPTQRCFHTASPVKSDQNLRAVGVQALESLCQNDLLTQGRPRLPHTIKDTTSEKKESSRSCSPLDLRKTLAETTNTDNISSSMCHTETLGCTSESGPDTSMLISSIDPAPITNHSLDHLNIPAAYNPDSYSSNIQYKHSDENCDSTHKCGLAGLNLIAATSCNPKSSRFQQKKSDVLFDRLFDKFIVGSNTSCETDDQGQVSNMGEGIK